MSYTLKKIFRHHASSFRYYQPYTTDKLKLTNTHVKIANIIDLPFPDSKKWRDFVKIWRFETKADTAVYNKSRSRNKLTEQGIWTVTLR